MTAVAEALPAPVGDLWIRYGIPVLLALVVHAMAVLALIEGWSVTDETTFTPRIEAIDARLIQLEQQAPPAPAAVTPAPRPQARPEPAPPAPAESAPRAEPAPSSAPAQAEAREAPEAETPAPPAPTRTSDFEDDALADLLDQALEDAIASEAALLSSQRADAAVASYVGAIVRRIEQNWSRPPSARNGMQARLLIDLVPTGEVVGVEVIEGSGNAAFDRSAQAAVRDAAPFEVPEDLALFEREFRRLSIVFRPEDLRN